MALAAEMGRVAAEHDAAHDRDATFVTEAYDAMHAAGYLRLAVPTDLGGAGATMRQLVLAQHELGRHSGAAALSSTMHHYLTLVQCWRRRRGAADADGVLAKVAEGLVMATSGGSDWVAPTTVATEVEGGYLFSGRKVFCSQAPVAGVVSTCAVLGEPGPGATVLHAGVPLSAPGVSHRRDLGHPRHARHRQPRPGVRGRLRPGRQGRRHPAVRRAGRPAPGRGHPLRPARRCGVPRRRRRRLRRGGPARLPPRHPSPAALRQIGDMRSRLRVALWALLASVDEIGEDPAADEATLETVMLAKRHAVNEARAVVDTALEVGGGAAFFRSSPLERAYRDVRGGPFHPLTPEATLELVGRRRG